ncbi:hypothetical protein GQX74_012683 [Glossina fuscipes]|nr:hypothetical protein GQX74_012683 [Glossina fuscipes]
MLIRKKVENIDNIHKMKVFIFLGCIAFIMWVGAFPNNPSNPNLEYEFIDTNKPSPNSNKQPELFPLTTDRSIPVAISTTPLPESDGTTFIYNPQTKTWTQLKKNEFPPSKDALLWNQSRDKCSFFNK